MQKNPKLSIVILNRNTKDLLRDCLLSLMKVLNEVDFEVIVVDNGSTDGSVRMLEDYSREFVSSANKITSKIKGRAEHVRDNSFKLPLRLIKNRTNLGFAKGNNKARNLCRGEYVLFLNTDTIVYEDTLKETIGYLEENKDVGALTCKIVLPSGKLDKDARRSFINPWNSLVHIYLKLDRIFPKSRLFSTYWYGYIPEDKVHEVDVIQGAYFLARKKVLDDVGWFDEDYFLDGEDIDLCWRIKEKGWKIIYYPKVKILHIKGATKGKNKEYVRSVSINEKLKYRLAGVNSMELFVKKRLWEKYPMVLNLIVISGIYLLKTIRVVRTVLFG